MDKFINPQWGKYLSRLESEGYDVTARIDSGYYKLPAEKQNELRYRRALDMERLRESGETYEAIGKSHGVTKERVRQILNKQLPVYKTKDNFEKLTSKV